MLDVAEDELTKLLAFSLFATFERMLRDRLAASLTPLRASPTTPQELALALYEYLADGSDDWRLDKVIEMFAPPVADPDVGNAQNIRVFRNSVAHGSRPTASIPPQTVYSQLTAFLKNASLLP